MSINSVIHGVFGHFQNLNLVILMHDLRTRRAAKGAWSRGTDLCPVAHGMPAGSVVSNLSFLGQAADMARGCDYAARHLGADPVRVLQFVDLWDAHASSHDWLLRQLEALWEERLSDADAVQEVLNPPPVLETDHSGKQTPAERANRFLRMRPNGFAL